MVKNVTKASFVLTFAPFELWSCQGRGLIRYPYIRLEVILTDIILMSKSVLCQKKKLTSYTHLQEQEAIGKWQSQHNIHIHYPGTKYNLTQFILITDSPACGSITNTLA